jgi:hypothetical protein
MLLGGSEKKEAKMDEASKDFCYLIWLRFRNS